MVTGGQRMNRLRNCGLLLSLVVAACASPGVEPASYDLQGRVDQPYGRSTLPSRISTH
jgi:hypothetical protein